MAGICNIVTKFIHVTLLQSAQAKQHELLDNQSGQQLSHII